MGKYIGLFHIFLLGLRFPLFPNQEDAVEDTSYTKKSQKYCRDGVGEKIHHWVIIIQHQEDQKHQREHDTDVGKDRSQVLHSDASSM